MKYSTFKLRTPRLFAFADELKNKVHGDLSTSNANLTAIRPVTYRFTVALSSAEVLTVKRIYPQLFVFRIPNQIMVPRIPCSTHR